MKAFNSSQVDRLARFGFATRGVVYILVGLLALMAILGKAGGRVTDNEGVLRTIGSQPFGQLMLVLVGLGLGGYAFWQFVRPDAKTKASRIGQLASGGVHTALAITSFQLASGNGGSGGGAQTWAGRLIESGAGTVVLILVGIGIMFGGLRELKCAYSESFLRHFGSAGEVRQWIRKFGRAGHAARGVVFLLVGISLILAGVRSDAGEAKGLDGALRQLGGFGPVVLGAVVLGLLAFGLYTLLSARYRRIPASAAKNPLRIVPRKAA